MNQDEILNGVAKAWDLMLSTKCPACSGGPLRLFEQSLEYNEEVKGMADHMKCVCASCGQPVMLVVPQPHMNQPVKES